MEKFILNISALRSYKYSRNDEYSNRYIWILLYFLLLIFPLGAVALGFALLLSQNNKNAIIHFAFITALYISFVNISKPIASDPDLPWYTEQYKMAGKMNLIKYIFWFGVNGQGRELFFPAYNYVIYFIAGNNLNLYRFILSMTCYMLSFYGIMRMGEYMRVSYWKISIPIIWFACFPWIFTYSQTILRQFLAGSFLMYIIVERFFYKKKVIIASICMVLTHTSSFIFLPFLFISYFRKPLKLQTSFAFFLVFLAFFFIQDIAGLLFFLIGSSDNALSYVLFRASSNTTFELPQLGIGKILFLLMFSVVCIVTYYNSSIRRKILIRNAKSHIAIINTFVIFCTFVISNIQQLELSNRLFTYATFLSAFPLYYIIRYFKIVKSEGSAFFIIMNLLLMVYFTHSSFTYEIPFGLLIYPLQFLI